jgi:hypothetical protein
MRAWLQYAYVLDAYRPERRRMGQDVHDNQTGRGCASLLSRAR